MADNDQLLPRFDQVKPTRPHRVFETLKADLSLHPMLAAAYDAARHNRLGRKDLGEPEIRIGLRIISMGRI